MIDSNLPDHLRTGETIIWGAEKKTNTAMIALAMILLAVFVYKRRLDPLEKIRRSQMASVNRQLPEFASRLVLLLGAGLVLSAAFEHIVEESRQTDSLQRRLCMIRRTEKRAAAVSFLFREMHNILPKSSSRPFVMKKRI